MSKPHRKTTFAYRNFNKAHVKVNREYWTMYYSMIAARSICEANRGTTIRVGRLFGVSEFPDRTLFLTSDEFLEAAELQLGMLRLSCIVMTCANLEEYLTRASILHALQSGYSSTDNPLLIDPIGRQLIIPLKNSSTIPSMLEYAEDLFRVSLGDEKPRLKEAYYLRCALAHNGGYVTPKVAKDVPHLAKSLHQDIVVEWAQLKDVFDKAERVCYKIDNVFEHDKIRPIEAGLVLAELISATPKIKKETLKQFLNDKYGFLPLGKGKFELAYQWARKLAENK